MHRDLDGQGRVAVLAGPGSHALCAGLGLPEGRPQESALLVHVALPGEDPAGAAAELAAHRAGGGEALVVVTGPAGDRDRLERAFVAVPPLSMANVAHLEDPTDRDGLVGALIAALGDQAVGAARRYPALRDPVARAVVAAAARRASAIGAAMLPGADMPALALLQVRMVTQLAAVHGRPMGPERAAEVAAVVASGWGWRGLARLATRVLPVPRAATRGGLAYASTRAVGEAAITWLSADTPGATLRARVEAVSRRTLRRA